MTLAQSLPLKVLSFPPGFEESVMHDLAGFSRTVRQIDSTAEVSQFLRTTQRGAFEMLQPFVGSGKNLAILEIGSGYGLGLCTLLINGFDVTGLEPGATLGFEGRIPRAQALLAHNHCDPERVVEGVGEAVPFPDNHFDVVFSIAVLEHVNDPDQVMREALRVCKPGGLVVMNVPNYDSFWEGHYNFTWWPYFLRSHRAAAGYVRWRGRSTDFVHELNFTRPGQFRRSAPWAEQAELVRVYPFLFRPLLYVSAFAYFAGIGAWDQHPLLRKFSPGKALGILGGFVAGCSRVFTWIATAIGLSPVFNVVARKRAAG